MMRWTSSIVTAGLLAFVCIAAAQNTPDIQTTDSTTEPTTWPTTGPAPKYAAPYGMPTAEGIDRVLTKVRLRLERGMVLKLDNPSTGKPIIPPAIEPSEAVPGEPTFETTGYPSGVAYAGLLAAGDATGDKAYTDFVAKRLQFFADTMPLFTNARGRNIFRGWIKPMSLDNCGAMGSAFIKARRANIGPDLKPMIDRFADFVSHKQYRLEDGTVARKNPFPDSIWGDDMYMSVPILAQMGALTNDKSYFDDAAKQVTQLSGYLFVPSSGLYTHAWHKAIGDDQPHYYWGRANGWCAMATVELLDVLPPDHPKRAELIALLKKHAQGLASVQSGSGLWHQMLDRQDSYLETSASAMFTYAIANGVNHGWLDADTYGPVAIAGWNGLTTRIDSHGHITGTCVGTSYAADYAYYYARPNGDDIHGYGPVLLAGSEIIKMIHTLHPRPSGGRGAPVMMRGNPRPADFNPDDRPPQEVK